MTHLNSTLPSFYLQRKLYLTLFWNETHLRRVLCFRLNKQRGFHSDWFKIEDYLRQILSHTEDSSLTVWEARGLQNTIACTCARTDYIAASTPNSACSCSHCRYVAAAKWDSFLVIMNHFSTQKNMFEARQFIPPWNRGHDLYWLFSSVHFIPHLCLLDLPLHFACSHLGVGCSDSSTNKAVGCKSSLWNKDF